MKKVLTLFHLILACLSIQAQEPLGLSMEDFDIMPGETKKVNISMQNTGYDIISAQFTLTLPEGLTLVRTGSNKPVLLEERIGYGMVEDEEMYSEKAIQVGTKNPYIFLIYSIADQLPFDGESGPFMTIAIKADANATIGVKDIKLSGIELSTKDAPHKTSDYVCKVNIYKKSQVIDYPMHESGVGTLLLPFNAEVPEGLQVFTATDVVDNVVVLEQQDFIEAGTPLIVIGENGEYVFTGVPTFMDEQANAGLLTGTTVNTSIDSGYVLQTQGNVTGFYRIAADTPITVPAFRCWLNYVGTANVIEFKDLPNSIQNIAPKKDTTTFYYDLLGRKQREAHTGIYIINNKKTLIRQ